MRGGPRAAGPGSVGVPVSGPHGRPQAARRRWPRQVSTRARFAFSGRVSASPGPDREGRAWPRGEAPPTATGGGACASRDGGAQRERPARREESGRDPARALLEPPGRPRSAPAAPPPAAPRAPAPGLPAAGAASRWTKTAAAAAAARAAVSVGGVAGRAGGLGWGSRTRGSEVGGRGPWSARGDGVPAALVPAGDRPGPRRAGPGDRVEGPGASGRDGRGRRRAGGSSSGSLAGLGGPSPGAGRLGGDLPRLLSPRASTPSGARPREHPQRRSPRWGEGSPGR